MSRAGLKLDDAKLRALLAAAQRDGVSEQKQVEAADYDWGRPHRFCGEQKKKLEKFVEQLAESAGEKLTGFYGDGLTLQTADSEELFAGRVTTQIFDTGRKDYFKGFADGADNSLGFVRFPLDSARELVAVLLGETGEQGDEQAEGLSGLEQTLLSDVADAVVGSVSQVLEDRGGKSVEGPGELVCGQCPIVVSPTDELLRVALEVEYGGRKGSIGVLMLSERVESLICGARSATAAAGGEKTAERMRGHLEQVPVYVEGRIGRVWAALREIMEIEAGDILVLDRKADEPIEVLVEGVRLFTGRPAKFGGKYSVLISSVDRNSERKV